jgi:hypothetical protein
MIIDNLYPKDIPISPLETDAPLIIDSDTILPGSVAVQFLQTIGRRCPQVVERHCPIEHAQFPQRHLLDIAGQFARHAPTEYLRCFI